MSESAAELDRAEALVAAGDLDGARAVAGRVLAADPASTAAHNVLGFVAHRQGRLADAEREFVLACAGPDADPDAEANLAALRAEVAALESEAEFGGTLQELADGLYGPELSPRLLGGLLGTGLEPDLQTRLDALPSATSDRERSFLLRFAARFWDGSGDVFENGPLLGGTTRALALGMLANPARRPGTRLHTHDWFSSRVGLDLPDGAFDRLVAAGEITAQERADMVASGSFQAVFDALHAGHDYSPLVVSHEGYLPGARGDVPAHGEAVYADPGTERVDLAFVDGCKSWYGTKHWLARTAHAMTAGGHVVFQDYGWFTCFWLPVLVHELADHLRLVAHVDDTYAFELVSTIDVAAIDARFPDRPADLGRRALDGIFADLLDGAGRRGDTHAMVAHTLQHAGALAYLGLLDEARARIAALRERPEFTTLRSRLIEPASVSPTYTPDGPILL